MIEAISRFFEDHLSAQNDEEEEDKICRLQLASATLLLELMKTDRKINDERTEAAFNRVLQRTFSLDDDMLRQISALAEEEVRQAVSLYEFTSLVNEGYSYEEKTGLIENMWRIALADDVLDKYEEQMIRKTADLIYVRHSDFIRTKLKVRDEYEAASGGG